MTKNLIDFSWNQLKKVVGTENILELPTPVMGGEDMAYFLEKAPGTFFLFKQSKSFIQTEKFILHHKSKNLM